MLLRDLIKIGVETISTQYPEGEAKEMVHAFLEHHIGTKRHTHIIEPAYEVPEEKALQTIAAFERMAAGEPMQYVAGVADFYGRQFRVSPDVLIPRPETELLCREALDYIRCGYLSSPRVLDLCTGSGCIAWTMALEVPYSEVWAADISPAALEVASSQDFRQEQNQSGAGSPAFILADILDYGSISSFASEGKYDLILSNPPYVMEKEKIHMRTNVLEHEPSLALFVSDDDPLIFYRAVAEWAAVLLAKDGLGVVEINEALGRETAELFLERGFGSAEVIRDLSGRDRFVRFKWQ